LLSDFNADLAVQSPTSKYFVSDSTQITSLFVLVSFRQEGRSRVVTNAERDVVDARALVRHRGRKARAKNS
jgi:hypothetical protein